MIHKQLHHHVSHPFVMVSSILSTMAVLFVVFVFPVTAATYKTFARADHGYTFQYVSTWTAVKGTKSTAVKPPTATISRLKSQGVAYSLSATYLNNDTAVFTTTLKNALAAGWTKFVSAYTKSLGQKYGTTPVVKKYGKTNWLASDITLKRRVNGVATTWRFIVITRDKKKVFVIAQKWTKNTTSPFATDVATLIKSFTTYKAPDTCGNAIGVGSTIVAGPSAPTSLQGGADYDSSFKSVTVHPTDPNKVWVGTERNGLLYTADGGTTWTRYRYGIRHIGTAGYTELWNMDVSAADPSKLLMVGNDSPGPLAGDYPSNTGGIYRSSNGGQVWIRRNCGLTNGQVSAVVYDPASTEIAYAGGRGGYPSFAQPGDAVYKHYDSGIYRTTDAGANWAKVTLPGPGNAATNDFWQIVARGTPATYVSFGFNPDNLSENVGFVKSTDGVVWTAMASEFRTKYVTDFDVSADAQVIIGSVRDTAEYIVSTDGGAMWTSVAGNGAGAIAISPADSNRIVYSTHSTVHLTTDRFATHTEIISPGAKIQDIVFAPADPNIVYFVAQGYLFYKSTDAGATFTLVKNLRRDVINVQP